MSQATHTIVTQALELSSSERIEVVEQLISSLDSPDGSIDAVWAFEADARVKAYEKGEIEEVSAKEVFDKYRTS